MQKHNLSVIIGPKTARKKQETVLFHDLDNFNTMSFAFNDYSNEDGYKHDCKLLNARKILPDSIADLITRRPYSTTSFIEIEEIENNFNDQDVINCIELYSFITKQFAELRKKKDYRLAISVFGTHPFIPLHKFPPYSSNIKSVLNSADLFIAYSQKASQYLRNLSVHNDKIRVIYPGIDLKMFSRKKKNHDTFRILFVGTFFKEKGLALLLKAFYRLYMIKPNVELWICSSHRTGELEPLARVYAKNCPVNILGYLDHQKIHRIYQQCDVFCHPSISRKRLGIKIWEEEFGFSLIEAMACGLAIVATDCGAMPEILGENNIIIQQNSSEQLFKALLRLFTDESFRLQIGKKNRKRAEEVFNLSKQKDMMNKVLLELT